MAKRYTSFSAVRADWRIKIAPRRMRKAALRKVGLYMRQWIRNQHGGGSLAKNSPLTVAMKGGNKPLIDRGKLRQAVSFRATDNEVIIFSKEPQLQRLHEFGARWKMTDKQRRFLFAMLGASGLSGQKRRGRPRTASKGMIVIPPRPIWRRALPKNVSMIKSIISSTISSFIK